jgi:serine protease AprX
MFLALPATMSVVAASPALLAIAAEAPDSPVSIIAHVAEDSMAVRSAISELGGEVTKDLHIINAFAARLSASAAISLAKSGDVRWISLDAPVEQVARPFRDPCATGCEPTYFLDTLNVREVWAEGITGAGIGVAIIDSGIQTDRDFSVEPGKPKSRIVWQQSFAADASSSSDEYGHGTHVAGIAGGHGGSSAGLYAGVAPEINLINLKVSNDVGMAYESDVVDALQWALENKELFNLRVINLSISSTAEVSYHESPLAAAAEILWFNGVVVVASSGNTDAGTATSLINAAPANDPFIITVGATDEQSTSDRADDTIGSFSAHGTTMDGFSKPEIVAPGKNIISVLADSSDWSRDYPERTVLDREYFRISGTSLSAPMVAGAAALMLQADPSLTPDQVKHRLTTAASTISDGASSFPYLDVHAVLSETSTDSANTGTEVSRLLTSGEDPVFFDSVSWNSVSWNSVSWNSVSWNSVSWNSVSWNSVSWNSVSWNSVSWNE